LAKLEEGRESGPSARGPAASSQQPATESEGCAFPTSAPTLKAARFWHSLGGTDWLLVAYSRHSLAGLTRLRRRDWAVPSHASGPLPLCGCKKSPRPCQFFTIGGIHHTTAQDSALLLIASKVR
jgi:hypothetical protein